MFSIIKKKKFKKINRTVKKANIRNHGHMLTKIQNPIMNAKAQHFLKMQKKQRFLPLYNKSRCDEKENPCVIIMDKIWNLS